MSNKQARLVSAIADAMKDQGFSQGNLARMSGVSQSMISAALLGKYDLKEEKWRLLCESLALDYDEIVSEPDIPQEQPAEETMNAAVCENHVEPAPSDQPPATSPQRPAPSDQPSATSPQRPALSDQPSATSPQRPALSEKYTDALLQSTCQTSCVRI